MQSNDPSGANPGDNEGPSRRAGRATPPNQCVAANARRHRGVRRSSSSRSERAGSRVVRRGRKCVSSRGVARGASAHRALDRTPLAASAWTRLEPDLGHDHVAMGHVRRRSRPKCTWCFGADRATPRVTGDRRGRVSSAIHFGRAMSDMAANDGAPRLLPPELGRATNPLALADEAPRSARRRCHAPR